MYKALHLLTNNNEKNLPRGAKVVDRAVTYFIKKIADFNIDPLFVVKNI